MPVRQMRSSPGRSRAATRSALPAWEISDDAGRVIGWVEQRRLRAASCPFYAAIGIHPVTGRQVLLELSADLYERIAVVYEFDADPSRFRQHEGWNG